MIDNQQDDLLRLRRTISTWMFSSISLTSVHLMNLDLLTSPSFPTWISTLRCSKLLCANYFSPPIVANTLASLLLFIITVFPSNKFSFCNLQHPSLHSDFNAVSPMKLSSSYSTFNCCHCPFRSSWAESSVSWLWDSSNWSRQGKFMRTKQLIPRLFIPLLRRLSTFKDFHLFACKFISPWPPKQLKLRLSFSSFFQEVAESGCIESASSPLSLKESSLSSANLALLRASTPLFLILLLLKVKQRTLSQLALQNSMASSSPILQRSRWISSTLLLLLNTFAISLTACMSITYSSLSRQWNLFSLYIMQFLEVQLVNFRLTSPFWCTFRMQRMVLSMELPIEAVLGIVNQRLPTHSPSHSYRTVQIERDIE